ncbi:MAG: nucleotide exchange factor GrpE [Bacteroidales bacterium]|nr:nucleotide exchange factor GrpE [Bacteroidales bacterium]
MIKNTENKDAQAQQETAAEKEQKVDKKAQKAAEKAEKAAEKENAKLNEKIAELEKELAAAKELAEKEKNDYLRLMADFENLRRHSAEDRINLIATASVDTIKGLLPVLDDCERAIEILSKSSDEAAKEGTNLIYNKLMAYLKTKGLEVIDAKGKKFDTDFHEAVAQFPVPEEDKKGLVFDVVTTGYTLNGNILRFAKVVVGI